MSEDLTELSSLKAQIQQLKSQLRLTNVQPDLQEHHWLALMQNTDDIILVLDSEDRLQSINRSLECLPLKLELGQPIYAHLPEEPARKLRKTMQNSRKVSVPQYFEQALTAADGSLRWYYTKVIGFTDAGSCGGAILIVTDITSRKRIDANLEQAMTDAQAANLAKNMFLAVMSHEIRTPLNGMMGMLQLLKLTALNNEQRDMVEIALHSSEGLLGLLTDLLDFSKIEAGRMELDQESFELRRLVEDVIAIQATSVQKKDLVLKCRIEHRVSDYRRGDILRLQQILTNLLNNAIKFTEKGEVSLRLSQGQAADEVFFEVSDTGIGIAPELGDVIFEPFMQADGSIRRKHGGTGLGLPICRRLVRAMGGELNYESRAAGGTRFYFSLKLPEVGLVTETLPEIKTVLPDGARVLVVEDNLVNQMVAVKMLEKLGLAADVALDGEQGLAAIAAKSYDLVLMDMMMPVLDGLDATRRLRAHESNEQHLTVIAMTANISDADREMCFAAGMDDFLPKPIAIENLKAILGRWLNSNESESQPETSDEQENLLKTVLDRWVLSELRELMPDSFEQMLKTFYRDTEKGLRGMREAAQRGYHEVLIRTAHSLKGSSGNFGAIRFAQLCAELQQDGAGLSPADELSRVAALSRVDELDLAYQQLKSALEAER